LSLASAVYEPVCACHYYWGLRKGVQSVESIECPVHRALQSMHCPVHKVSGLWGGWSLECMHKQSSEVLCELSQLDMQWNQNCQYN